ncbi:kinase [Serinibacter arcticus]|uniref:non-specific serine/threonine protein kinase n=1 Tax=Serinibacter arcticus TaxID=1655435 RepID=A0A2U1ZVN2_9MICO|nr:serine/threonine-protein kinase [Serinibacter arcticus]PWD50982.1 kinase [Serinibacter arcticus]
MPEIPGVDLGEVIGRGGNAVVYAGVQRAVQRPVAVKIDSRAVSQERNQRRFVREATAAGRISSHPHVVSLIDAGTTSDDHPYLVMELCERGSLADLLRRDGALPAVDALDIGIAVTGALAAAHEAGILHRDVKPGNILIDAYGTPRLSDFGLAARQILGDEAFSATLEALTPAYAPPEVFTGGVPTTRSDVWSMGATVYAMLVGGAPRRRPDGGSLPLTEIVASLPERLPAPDVPGADVVMPVLWRATAYDAANRHASAAELRSDLQRVRALLGPSTGHVGGPEVTVVTAPPAALELSLRGSPVAASTAHGAVAPGAVASGAVASGAAASRRPRRWLPIALAASALVLGGTVGSLATRAGLDGAAGAGAAESSSSAEPGATPVSGTASDATPDATPVAETPEAPAPPVDACWGGLVVIGGNVSADPRSCTEPHRWESYATGYLDGTTESARVDDVAADPAVVAACTLEALGTYLGAPADPAAWRLDVVPPSEAAFLAGDRGFSCIVAPVDGAERTSSILG